MSRAGVIVVFAKAPRPGLVKTRLSPPLSLAQAAELYRALLDDVLEVTARCAGPLGLEPVLAVHPPDACAELAAGAPTVFRVVRQRGRSLAERMSWAVREAMAGGARRVLLRGSDSPLLCERELAAALDALEEAELVLAPDRDGGYGLVGLGVPCGALFAHPMSTASVLADTLANARARGLRTRLLAPGFDIDEAGDLALLAREREAAARLCPRTLELLDAGELWNLAGGTGRA